MNPETAAAFSLLSAEAVRTRTKRMLALGLDDKLPNFRVDLAHLDATAERVIAVTNQAYPSLDIPFHSRWRHFVVKGDDRFATIAKAAAFPDAAARARAEFEIGRAHV